jgi:hypothetical protein
MQYSLFCTMHPHGSVSSLRSVAPITRAVPACLRAAHWFSLRRWGRCSSNTRCARRDPSVPNGPWRRGSHVEYFEWCVCHAAAQRSALQHAFGPTCVGEVVATGVVVAVLVLSGDYVIRARR